MGVPIHTEKLIVTIVVLLTSIGYLVAVHPDGDIPAPIALALGAVIAAWLAPAQPQDGTQ